MVSLILTISSPESFTFANALPLGNCMFSALSHQIYGHTRKALHIRIAVVNYLREHSAEFKHFINYDGERRSPSRGCTRGRGRYSSTSPAREEVESKVNATWERYLSSMAKQGEWGDNLTLRAFALAFNRSVRVYQKDGEQDISADEERHEMVKIAYHVSPTISSMRIVYLTCTGLASLQLCCHDFDGFCT